MNCSGLPLNRKKIRNLTKMLREMLGCENQLYFPIIAFLEYLAYSDDNFNYEIVEPKDMPDTYAETYPDYGLMRIRQDVYEAAAEGNPRHRFTLCHELGHYLLHQSSCISYARGNLPAYRDPEWQANTFAGELMAPYDLIKDMSVSDISEKCGMSKQAATIQYNESRRC